MATIISNTLYFFVIFTILIFFSFIGIGSMLRFYPPDVLHTLNKGIVEFCVGFTLQIVKVVGTIDSTFSRGASMLTKTVKNFPAYNSFQPVRHVHFEDIFELQTTPTGKGTENPYNTTGLLRMKESFKLMTALIQIYVGCVEMNVLPDHYSWSKDVGFSQPYFSVQQVVVNAINATLEVYWYSTATSLTETQLKTFSLLVANAQGHMLVLDVVRKRLLKRASTLKGSFEDFNVQNMALMTNPKLELLSHFPESRRDAGCDNHVRDTNEGELYMKIIRTLFNTTSKRHDSYLKEMLRKHQHLAYLQWIRKGLDYRQGKGKNECVANEELSNVRKHSGNHTLKQTDVYKFESNGTYKNQHVVFCDRTNKFVQHRTEDDLNLHPLLKMVSTYIISKMSVHAT